MREIPLQQTRALRQAVLRSHETVQDMAAHEPTGAFAAGAFDGSTLVSSGFIAPDGDPGAWRIRGMATQAHARGAGAGGAVLEALMQHALAQGASRVWCNARVGARAFYERAGFRVTSEEFEIPEIGPHLVMERRLATGAVEPPSESSS